MRCEIRDTGYGARDAGYRSPDSSSALRHSSPIPHLISHIPHLASRISYLVSRIPHLVSHTMANPLPAVDVAVTVIARGALLLAVYNPSWGAFTLPMTKRRQFHPEPSVPLSAIPED